MSVVYRVKLKNSRPKPCLVAALEFIGIDDPSMPEGRVRQALSRIAEDLGDEDDLKKHYESHWSLAANRALYVAPTKRDGMLPFRVILKVLHVQISLIPLGIFVRGAISVGEATTNGELMTGQGITYAERLRDEVADMPRVIVDPAMLRAIDKNPNLWAPHHDSMDELRYIHDLLREDSDGLWFIDYLRASSTEVGELEDYYNFLHDHKVLVQRKLENAHVLNRNTRALTWLWHYHEQRIDSLGPKLAEGLYLPASSPVIYRFPPSAIDAHAATSK